MTSNQILSLYEAQTLTRLQRVCFATFGLTILGWWAGWFSLAALLVVGVAGALGAVRWQGEWLAVLALRVVRHHFRSRFTAVASSLEGDRLVVTCRGHQSSTVWRSDHCGRLDLRDEEQSQWAHFLRQVDAAAQRGEAAGFSFHVRGNISWVATSGLTLSSPWVPDGAAFANEIPRWIFESWNDVQSPDFYYRTFDIRDFRQGGDSLIDSLSDRDGRWSVHAHFYPSSRRSALRRSRRDRHAAEAAMSWRGIRGATSPATLTALRVTRQHHEDRVARGATLINFRLCVVIRAHSRDELNEVSQLLRERALRHGITLHAPRGEQARALRASWPGASSR